MISATTDGDRQLLEGMLRSDTLSIKSIYDLALPSVIMYVRQNSGSEADARDIFQDALLALYRKLEDGDFELTCTLKSYLRIVCRNLWLYRLRSDHKYAPGEVDSETVELPEDMVDRLQNNERTKLYLKHFDALGEKCRKILHWYFDKVSMKEIAARLETSEGYIKKRKFQCKEQLVDAIKSDVLYDELKT